MMADLLEYEVECPACHQTVDLVTEIIADNGEDQGGEGITCTRCQKGDKHE